MSAEAVGWVYRHSPYKGQFLAVHLAIADVVNDQAGNQLWMALPNLSLKARVDRGTAKRAIDHMCSADEWGGDVFLRLLRASKGGRSRPATYQFLFPPVPVIYETRVTDAATEWQTRVCGTEPAHHAPKPAQGARRVELNEPNGTSLRCPNPVCGQSFPTLAERDDHYENCGDPDFVPADAIAAPVRTRG